MNKQELALLLQSCRPDGPDAGDPRFAKALEWVRRHPTLEQWFTEQQAFDRALSERLRAVPVPPELKANLLASQSDRKPGAWNLVGAWLTLAASMALVVMVALNWRIRETPADFAAYRETILPRAIQAAGHLDHTDSDIVALGRALTQAGAPAPQNLPRGLRHLHPIGCRTLDWQGRRVGLITYLPNGHQLLLLTVRRAGFQGVPPSEIPSVARVGAWSLACWTDPQTIYLLIAPLSPAGLQRYL
jgi:hypothetical protein